MLYLKSYLKKLEANGKLANAVSSTAEEIGKRYIETFSFTGHEVGLLFGNIQSGKTSHMFGIICKAADLGFPVFLLLTTDNVVLQQQTLNRVKSDLKGFCICGENDSRLFLDNNLVDPAIIVIKKNSKMLRLWTNTLRSSGFMSGNPLFVVDDEGDAASLNTLVNQGKQSSINKYLTAIKQTSSCSLYLQVTGTPQALLLQSLNSGWHPYFTYYFEPGETYIGGDFFFPKTGKPACVRFIDNQIDFVRTIIIRHLTVSAQIMASGGKVCNCLFHPSARVFRHEEFAKDIKKELDWCREQADSDLIPSMKDIYDSINPVMAQKVSFDAIQRTVKDLLTGTSLKILIINGKNDTDEAMYSAGCNFIIGGNTLGRGITFPCLQTICYTRESKTPQADTMWQHSRMFGYDRDPGLISLYISELLYKLFSDINATNNSLIAQIERGIDNIKVYYPKTLKPTRKNVLDNRCVSLISGGTNYYPSKPDNDSIELISDLLRPFDDTQSYYQVSLRFIKEILSHIIPSEDFNLHAFMSVLDTLLADRPTCQGILIPRRERDIAQGTGAMLSPNDWQLGASFTDRVVLTIYQVTGTKGWGNKKLWIPNIKLPDDTIYYDVQGD